MLALFCFSKWSFDNFFPGLASNCYHPISTPWVSGITSVNHCAQYCYAFSLINLFLVIGVAVMNLATMRKWYAFFSPTERSFPQDCWRQIPAFSKLQKIAECYFIMKLNGGGSFITVINNIRMEKKILYWSRAYNYFMRVWLLFPQGWETVVDSGVNDQSPRTFPENVQFLKNLN
jgi:hypothetical protein